MRSSGGKRVAGGFTLVEILIGLAILGILVILGIGNFSGINERYKVEGETKQLYADLMDARGRAMQRNRAAFVQIHANDYQTYEDTSPAPDGDGTLQPAADTLVANSRVSHAINTSDIAALPLVFRFNRNGIAPVDGFIRFVSTVQPDYDCITIKATRIKMGKYNAAGNTCDEK